MRLTAFDMFVSTNIRFVSSGIVYSSSSVILFVSNRNTLFWVMGETKAVLFNITNPVTLAKEQVIDLML